MAEELSYPLEEIKGMTAAYAKALRDAGIEDSDAFLDAAKTPASRRKLAEESKVPYDDVLSLANRADLMRVNGIGEKYGDLLEIAGVDTVPELAQRNSENLRKALEEANNKKELIKALPAVSAIEGWVAQAKKLGRRLEY